VTSLERTCELPGCLSEGEDKKAVGRFQVYDGKTPTLTRPADMCQGCLDYSKSCGLEPAEVPNGAC
jgi:hypothetical protein